MPMKLGRPRQDPMPGRSALQTIDLVRWARSCKMEVEGFSEPAAGKSASCKPRCLILRVGYAC